MRIHQTLADVNVDSLGLACRSHGIDEKCVRTVIKYLKERYSLVGLHVHGRNLKWILDSV
jgi:hypothetical protein